MKMIVDARQQYFPEFADLATQMNHDLRSPLTAICSYAECLALGNATEPAARERYARVVIAEARRLGRMASNFVVLSAPQQDHGLEQLDLSEVLRDALEELREVLELQETVVDFTEPARSALVTWHRPVLLHLLIATLESVLGHSGSRASVAISFIPQVRDVAVLVGLTDEGAHPPDTRSFAFRAAARLVGTRGGSLLLLDGAQPRLRLVVPRSGALYVMPGNAAPALGKSA